MIAPAQLAEELRSGTPPIILDVRLADDYEACHLEGAMNNAVFEVAFGERLESMLPDKSKPVCVCGASSQSMEAKMAVEKLERIGYAYAVEIEGGMEACLAAGLANTCGIPLAPPSSIPDGRVLIDLEQSYVGWTGRNLLNKHHGFVRLSEGWLDFKEGQITGGEFILNMERLECTDLAGSDYHSVLIRHLQDHDFFDVSHFPEARVAITAATHVDAGEPGGNNLHVCAELTLKGCTHPIEFSAAAGVTPEGHAAAQARFSIDRTKWGVLYGSGRFFHRLAGHLVNDMIEIEVKIVTS